MNILMDVDGVLCDFIGAVSEVVGRAPEDFRDPLVSDTLSREELARLEQISCKPGWCYRLPWYPGARNFLHEISQLGTIYAVTRPYISDTWCAERMAWLSPWIPKENVIFTQSKHLIRGDVLIEDTAEHLNKWLAESNDNLHGLLINRPWNENELLHFNADTCYDYNQVLSYLKGIL